MFKYRWFLLLLLEKALMMHHKMEIMSVFVSCGNQYRDTGDWFSKKICWLFYPSSQTRQKLQSCEQTLKNIDETDCIQTTAAAIGYYDNQIFFA